MATKYFTNNTFKFLRELENNNNRIWFNDNKQRYEDLIRTPSLKLIEDISEVLPSLSPHFRARSKKIGGSLMRVYRDLRFAKDKTPYKIHIGINIRHESAQDMHYPCYFLHIANYQCYIGLGVWHPESATLKKIRTCLDENPRAWQSAKNDSKFSKSFELGGSSLVNNPRSYDKEHPLIEDLKRKDFIARQYLEKSIITSPDLLEIMIKELSKASPFMRYLCYAVDLPFD